MFARHDLRCLLTLGALLVSGLTSSLLYADSDDRGMSPFDPSSFSLNAEPITPLPLTPPIDPDKRALGQKLFFDQRLSEGGDQSCADCHQLPAIGLDESSASVMTLPASGERKRDIPLLYNVPNYFWFNWDGRYSSLKQLIDGAVSSTDKFNSNWRELIARVGSSYQTESQRLYASELTSEVVTDALVTFLRSLNAPNAPIDRYLRGEKSALTEQQREGYALFKRIGCSSCHNGRSIGANLFEQFYIYRHDGGEEGEPLLKDLGRFYVTGEESDRNSFRVPSLRNVAVTAPYFHDGSANTLDEAIEEMLEHQLGVLPTEQQIELLVAFLHSLTGVHAGVRSADSLGGAQ